MTPLYFYRPRPTRVPFIGVPIGPFAGVVFVAGVVAVLGDSFTALGVAFAGAALGTAILYVLTEYDDRVLAHIARRVLCRVLHLDRTRDFWHCSAYAPQAQGPLWLRRRRRW